MHEQHDVFQAPSNPDIPIWRYMDLAKSLSMVQAQALHFARVDTMPDEFEGSISRPTEQNFRSMLSENRNPDERFEEFVRNWRTGLTGYRKYSYISCWHMNEQESAAMWAIYQSGEPRGIAVRSTYQRLKESITDQRPVWIGKVDYIDFDTDILPWGNAYYPYVCKRKSFEHEREIRAFYPGEPWVWDESGGAAIEGPIGPPVVPITVDLDRLVEAVYVSPKAPKWFAGVIRDALSRYRRTWDVHHSSLDNAPLY
jgi:hypothetical protein